MIEAAVSPASLPSDLHAAAAALGPIVGCRRLTTLAMAEDLRACWRVDLADGRSVKLRRLATREEAARMRRAHEAARSPHLPALIGGSDRIVIESWIPGRCLDAIDVDPALARRCGAALASLHRDQTAIATPVATLREARRREAEASLGLLIAGGALGEDRGRQAAALLAAAPIDEAEAGIIHGDFCGENAVLAADGGILAVDNETMRPELLDYDLGRVWYRWPMTRAARHGFLDGYAARRSPAPFLAAAKAWVLQGLLDAASYRLTQAATGAAIPLAAIDRLLSSSDDGDPAALIAQGSDDA